MDILLYEIILKEKVSFLYFFKSIKTTKYELYYKIDEDRNWFIKKINNKIVDSHHTKNNLVNSVKIMDGIKDRFNTFIEEKKLKEKINITFSTNVWDFPMIAKMCKNIEKPNPTEKSEVVGIFLSGKNK